VSSQSWTIAAVALQRAELVEHFLPFAFRRRIVHDAAACVLPSENVRIVYSPPRDTSSVMRMTA
jgi:hypothetical protein